MATAEAAVYMVKRESAIERNLQAEKDIHLDDTENDPEKDPENIRHLESGPGAAKKTEIAIRNGTDIRIETGTGSGTTNLTEES